MRGLAMNARPASTAEPRSPRALLALGAGIAA